VVVGFAAETHDVEHYARGKLQRKKLDMIAANQVGREGCGFESDDNALTVIDAETAHALGPAAKTALADALLDLIRARF
jgi:phosphopantothenoylcysteine decarboxylase/phosphopantothenate--cysteine ligase